MSVKRGDDLPLGTEVYIYGYDEKNMCVFPRKTWIDYDNLNTCRITFYIIDELWASFSVIELWDLEPHSHPRVTLFDLLNKKLQI
jgi:hypothetical protein